MLLLLSNYRNVDVRVATIVVTLIFFSLRGQNVIRGTKILIFSLCYLSLYLNI